MSTNPNPLANVTAPPATIPASRSRSVRLFSPQMQTLWSLVALLTVAPELMPTIRMTFVFATLYYAIKVLSFHSLGFLAPLAFRSLNGIGLGMVLSFLSAALIETSQGLLHNGHVFHWLELAGKLSLIAFGFALALDCRYERRLSLWPFRINFRLEN